MQKYLVYCYRDTGTPSWYPLATIEAKNKKEAISIAYSYNKVSSKALLKAVLAPRGRS
jgi:hypothetical protein